MLYQFLPKNCQIKNPDSINACTGNAVKFLKISAVITLEIELENINTGIMRQKLSQSYYSLCNRNKSKRPIVCPHKYNKITNWRLEKYE